MDFENLSAHEKKQMVTLIEEKQAKQFVTLFAYVVETCFADCVSDFTSKSLTDKEASCASICTEKILKLTNRIGQRMSEKQAAAPALQ
ncbi:protein transporter tim9 [Mitosporidium daphniae]